MKPNACSLHGVMGRDFRTWSALYSQFLKLFVLSQNEFANDYMGTSHNHSQFTSIRNETGVTS